MQAFLAFLSNLVEALTSGDHTAEAERIQALATQLAGVEPGEDVSAPEDATDDQREALAAWFSVSDDDITNVRDALRDAATAIGATNPELVSQCADFGASDGALGYVAEVRATADAQAAEAAEAALGRFGTPPAADGGSDEDAAADAARAAFDALTPDEQSAIEAWDSDTVEAFEGIDADAAAGLAEITASMSAPPAPGARLSRIRDRGPAQSAPTDEVDDSEQWQMLTEAGGVPMGATVSREQMLQALHARSTAVARSGSTGGPGVDDPVARLSVQLPESHRLDTTDPHERMSIMRERIAEARAEARDTADADQAIGHIEALSLRRDPNHSDLTATGGISAPPVPVYSIARIGSAVRPLMEFLPTWQAERGGVSYRRGRGRAAVHANDAAAGVGTYDDTAAEADDSKDELDLPSAQAVVTREIQAVYQRSKVNNFTDRFDREQVEDQLGHAEVQWAAAAETALLTQIATDETVGGDLTSAAVFGIARDFLISVNELRAQIASIHRLADTDVLDVIAPYWLRAAVLSDLTGQMPGDGLGSTLLAEWDATLREARVRVGYTMDQDNAAALAAGALAGTPATFDYQMFEPGHHVVLTAGELTVGPVRDSANNATNDFSMMTESFEGLASPGVVSARVAQASTVSGATRGTVAP